MGFEQHRFKFFFKILNKSLLEYTDTPKYLIFLLFLVCLNALLFFYFYLTTYLLHCEIKNIQFLKHSIDLTNCKKSIKIFVKNFFKIII